MLLAKGAGHKSIGNLVSIDAISVSKVSPAIDVPNVDLPIKLTLKKDIYTIKRSVEFKLDKMIVLTGIKFAMPKDNYLKKFDFRNVDYSVLYPKEMNMFDYLNNTPIVSRANYV